MILVADKNNTIAADEIIADMPAMISFICYAIIIRCRRRNAAFTYLG